MKRYPNGVEAPYFYEKQCPKPTPPFVETCQVARHHKPGSIQFCLANNLPTLVWAANLGDLELHTFLSRAPDVHRPTEIVFDLDPGPPADIILCCKVGLRLKELLAKFGLESFPKTSGSKGIQVYVPLNTRVTYEKTKQFAHAMAETLERESPESVVSKMQKNLRAKKVLVDWSQNDIHKTTVCVYSLRAKEHPTVSTPVTWEEIASALKKRSAKPLTFEAGEVLKRVEKQGDLFAPVLKLKQKLPAL